ncbi:MAG: YkgJ family cysteine cluster protein [Terracidiphilus sp.]
MSAAFADAAQRAGERLVCRQGCTQCCHGVFALNPLDALRLRSGMDILRATEPALAAEIEHRAGMWIVEHQPGFPGNSETGLLGTSNFDRERFEGFANEAPCPALDPETGRCDVYEWRPMTCRIFGPPVRMGDGGALGHCELCFKGASEAEVAACEMTVPFDLESELLGEIPTKDETVVAYALLK